SGNEETYVQQVTVEENPDYGKKIVYLTFDDGPSENTGEILKILEKYDVPATFFVTGNQPNYNKFMKEAAEKGHTIGLHTYSHKYDQLYSSEQAYFEDLQKISDLVEQETGVKADCIRFPGGSSNSMSAEYSKGLMTRLVAAVHEAGYQYFDWNADSTDASGNGVSVDQIIANSTAPIASDMQRVNILFHDTDAKDTTVEALPAIIEAYRDAGYVFRGVSKDGFAPHHQVSN
ncbi:MAG: polysaccharide deacetylase, partial [Erysipelotrichaceae bacterium]|nr:polysaccharide deacetylase [Erysipelotrichaceae bacterium]